MLEPKFLEAFSPLISSLKILLGWLKKTTPTLGAGKNVHQWTGDFIVGKSINIDNNFQGYWKKLSPQIGERQIGLSKEAGSA